jgi:anti-sigma regulatory factor (Ser/Thr protein kinase)
MRRAAEHRSAAVDAGGTDIGEGDHLVQFYERDAELLAAVTPYLAAAVRADEVAIVIATSAHRRGLEAKLRADGVDLVQARADGMFLSFDAAATMALFTIDGRIDRDSFHEVIGGIVRAAAASGRRVRAYGEMVALLWDAGDVLGAIELERLWHELGREVSFSLFCSYPAASVSGSEHAHALHQVCDLHSAVVEPPPGGAWELLRRRSELHVAAGFTADRDMPGRARRLIVAALEQSGHDKLLVGDAALVLSELASNAVLHAGTPFSVTVRTEASTLRVAVQDSAPLHSRSHDGGLIPRPTHGLGLVEALSSCWGVEAAAGGKVVWAELAI